MIQMAILFIIIGAVVKYGKAYFLIAGYNTLPKKEKAKYNIDGIATVFRNTFFAMAIGLLMGYFLSDWINIQNFENIVAISCIVIGVTYLLIKSNSKKFKIAKKQN
ncbi:protein of unknown function [Pricia antarctica]|uniref:DUF3784 domain-containing protein n=1 Tax=Pricia antarctica TaxID=641691 RepID=A0A1G7G8S0_9FLAO|nr:DUF3784 domain-containing protein [Pricia antarctica]SDE84512.1 protein of unknown function [Pricia antarctica]